MNLSDVSRWGDRQQCTNWFGLLRQPLLIARQHIYSISHITAHVSAWQRTWREEGSRPISFSTPSSRSLDMTHSLYNKVSWEAFKATFIQHTQAMHVWVTGKRKFPQISDVVRLAEWKVGGCSQCSHKSCLLQLSGSITVLHQCILLNLNLHYSAHDGWFH